MVTPADLTVAQIVAYFEEHCECRPTDVERRSHSHDCDDRACEDARVALGGRPDGCGYRGTVEAIIHTQAARRAICDAINTHATGDLSVACPTCTAAPGTPCVFDASERLDSAGVMRDRSGDSHGTRKRAASGATS